MGAENSLLSFLADAQRGYRALTVVVRAGVGADGRVPTAFRVNRAAMVLTCCFARDRPGPVWFAAGGHRRVALGSVPERPNGTHC